MVSLQTIRQSNAHAATTLPKGLVALFIGATSGIGQSTLTQLAHHAPPRIYTVARPQSAPAHAKFLDSLRESHPNGTYNLLTADVSLVSSVDKIVKTIVEKESRLDILFLSVGFMTWGSRDPTPEGLDWSMSTRYYSRMRAVQLLVPLLKKSILPSPRIVSVLAGGMEAPLNEGDLDLREEANWHYWQAALHTATMGTLVLERFARENPELSVLHWAPGLVATPGLEKAKKEGKSPPGEVMSAEESGERGLFLATSDRYAVREGLVAVPEGIEAVRKSGGGIYLVDPLGEGKDNEEVLGEMRKRGVDGAVWEFTQKVFDECLAKGESDKTEL
ncbi:hypothetical protein N0V90_001551 [Kalmusia sp. IMI 367209]|nr:hypothetical protein N0V90_001551 [Kalmusia sp. IMI 367209]